MEKLTNKQFFELSCSGYMPIHITLKHAFYLRLDALFSRQTRNGFVYSGEIYELKGSDFTPVLDVDIYIQNDVFAFSLWKILIF